LSCSRIASLSKGWGTSAAPARSTSDIRSSRSSIAIQRLANGCAAGVEHVPYPARSLRASRLLGGERLAQLVAIVTKLAD